MLQRPFANRPAKHAAEAEADMIFSLLAYALTYADWQPEHIPRSDRRGYNIGSVLVDPAGEAVHYGLNCVSATNNSTQHGEIRLITQYLEKSQLFSLDGYTIYTTLEPCAMCAGMMTMTSIDRVVYGQSDDDFSKALERLALNSEPFGGYAPYPRIVLAEPSPSPFKLELDQACQSFLASDEEKIMAKFLSSEKARAIFNKAVHEFENFTVRFDQNTYLYKQAVDFYKKSCHDAI